MSSPERVGSALTSRRVELPNCRRQGGVAMPRIFKNEDHDFGLSIALGSAYSGQADVGECLAVADRIKDGNADSWVEEWTGAAIRAREGASNSEGAGHRASARGAWL